MSSTEDEKPILIVSADDFGLTDRVSAGILEAHERGVVTSTSVIAVAPAFVASAKLLRDVPSLGVGAHFTAVGEDRPLLSAREIPSLVDKNGKFWPTWRSFVPRAAAGRIDPDDLRREFAAQLEAITSAGLVVDHFDTHQNIHLWPTVSDVLLELGDVNDVHAIRVMRSEARGPVGVTVRRLSRGLEKQLKKRRWAWTGAATGLDEAGSFGLGEMVDAVGRLASSGASSAELATHPGLPHDPERARYRWNYNWDAEFNALCSETVRIAIEELGFRLGTFADLPRWGV
ncbi:MAG: ChbG/HpnK family deacetylase [Acidimicrobiales bacterium]